MKIGHKIRQFRELKKLSQENMADTLKMSLAGYGRIERNEVDINIERLQEIASILNTKPEDILAFDDKYVFNSYDKSTGHQVINHHYVSEEERKLYEDRVRLYEEAMSLLKDKMSYLEKEIERLTSMLNV